MPKSERPHPALDWERMVDGLPPADGIKVVKMRIELLEQSARAYEKWVEKSEQPTTKRIFQEAVDHDNAEIAKAKTKLAQLKSKL